VYTLSFRVPHGQRSPFASALELNEGVLSTYLPLSSIFGEYTSGSVASVILSIFVE
jgi:hypothetical protein